jgi:hypothetical protein
LIAGATCTSPRGPRPEGHGSGATGITSLEPLRDLPLLHLDLAEATGVATLAPLRGHNPHVISDASPALLATLEE